MPRFRTAVVCATLLFWAAPAGAVTVAIVRPATPSPESLETLSHLHGELLSVGLDVEIADAPTVGDPAEAWVGRMAAERGVDAVIVIEDAVPAAVDVWFIDKAPAKPELVRVALEPDTEKPAERLAIRAIEVLRSRFLELDLNARARRRSAVAKPPVAAAVGEVHEPPARAERLGVAVGAAVLTSLDGVGAALLPIVRVDWVARTSLVLQAAVAGLGSRPMVADRTASARVAQQYGLVGVCYRLGSGRTLRPFAALSAGALHTSVTGQADAPKQGHAVDQWSLLAEGSLGTGLGLGGRYYLTLAAHVQVAAPYVAIHIVDQVVATSGRPNLLLTLTVGAWL